MEAGMKRIGTLAAALLLTATCVQAEIVVVSNDGKQQRPGDMAWPEPDSISVLDVAGGKARLLGSVAAPATLTGPPTAVAVSKDGKFALVTSGQKIANGKVVNDDLVEVIDISNPKNPRLVQTVHAGLGVMGISISPDGRLALAVNNEAANVSVFTLHNRRLTPAGIIPLEANCDPTDVFFLKGGRRAVVVERGHSKLRLLEIAGTRVTDSGQDWLSGRMPYGGAATPDGRYFVNGNLGGALPPPGAPAPARGGRGGGGTAAMTEIATGKVVAQVPVGNTPEHTTLSPNGRYAAVVVQNGTGNTVPSSPNYSTTHGLLVLLAVGNGTLTKLGEVETGHWCQGGAFMKDSTTFLLGCAIEREIEVFHVRGGNFVRDPAATITVGARPGDIQTALTR
jgi:DNA-binding beta-propeller fold protein YncE